jgi:antitoxin (DNA-binding transcriptional repressor) of toxin-antitoxin stability system
MTVSVSEAQAKLPELIARLSPGEILQITQDDRLVAKLVKQLGATPEPRQPGSAIGKLRILADDEEHLEHFQEYLP